MKIDSKASEADASGRNNENSPTARISPINGTKSALASEFNNVLTDIEYLVKDVAQLTGDDLARASVKINERVATARKAAESVSDTLTERAQQTFTTTNDYVQRQPWTAIGIGTTIGLMLGIVLTRR